MKRVLSIGLVPLSLIVGVGLVVAVIDWGLLEAAKLGVPVVMALLSLWVSSRALSVAQRRFDMDAEDRAAKLEVPQILDRLKGHARNASNSRGSPVFVHEIRTLADRLAVNELFAQKETLPISSISPPERDPQTGKLVVRIRVLTRDELRRMGR